MSVFPHLCPKCGSPAYVGFRAVECSNPHCPHAGPSAKAHQRKSRAVSSFVCWSSGRGGPPCAGIVVVSDGAGVCPDCGSHYATAASAHLPAPP